MARKSVPTARKVVNEEEMTRRLKAHPAYRLAYKDLDFLGTPDCRPIRLQLELLKPELILQEHKIVSTIVVFGSTRILSPEQARRVVDRLEKELERSPRDRELRRQLQIAKSVEAKSHYYEAAREFGRLVSEESQTNSVNPYVIVTGGGPGIMEGANRGAFDVDAKTIGLNITLATEQEPNPYITPELCMQFHYFAVRKMHFMLRARALVAFPGGYGTLDELFEALTLVQTGVMKPLPIILFGEEYWKGLINFQYLVDQGTIDIDDINLFVYADSARDAWEYIQYFYADEGNGHGIRDRRRERP